MSRRRRTEEEESNGIEEDPVAGQSLDPKFTITIDFNDDTDSEEAVDGAIGAAKAYLLSQR